MLRIFSVSSGGGVPQGGQGWYRRLLQGIFDITGVVLWRCLSIGRCSVSQEYHLAPPSWPLPLPGLQKKARHHQELIIFANKNIDQFGVNSYIIYMNIEHFE